ncbi:MAG: hypothetical protein AVDCRST_MAG90-1418, partial [uncultured Microvirga sp.]
DACPLRSVRRALDGREPSDAGSRLSHGPGGRLAARDPGRHGGRVRDEIRARQEVGFRRPLHDPSRRVAQGVALRGLQRLHDADLLGVRSRLLGDLGHRLRQIRRRRARSRDRLRGEIPSRPDLRLQRASRV